MINEIEDVCCIVHCDNKNKFSCENCGKPCISLFKPDDLSECLIKNVSGINLVKIFINIKKELDKIIPEKKSNIFINREDYCNLKSAYHKLRFNEKYPGDNLC